MKTIPFKIDRHIENRTRKPERIKEGELLAVQQPPKARTEALTPVSGLIYNCHYFIAQRYAREITGNVSVPGNYGYRRLVYNHTDSGAAGSGSYDPSNKTWQDTSKSWTANEWRNHYLKVNSIYYLITSNTADTLTLAVPGDIPDDSLAYSIVPFKKQEFFGAYLRPDTNSSRRYSIVEDKETYITVRVPVNATGTVTTGDASAPYNTFRDTSKAGNYATDYWKDYSVRFTSGANRGVAKKISSYDDTTGEFVTADFSNAIAVGDTYELIDDLQWVGTSTTFRIEGYVCPKPADFLDSALAPIGNVFNKQITTTFGELNESNLPDYYNAIYSIKLKASKSITMTMDVDCRDSLRIIMTDITTAEVFTIIDSGFRPTRGWNIKANFPFLYGHEYRIDISFYAEDGKKGFAFGVKTKTPFGFYISEWGFPRPSPPEWVYITGSGDAGDPSAHDATIVLRWKPPQDLFGADPPEGIE